MKSPGSALHMADRFTNHLSHSNIGTEKFRALQLTAIENREEARLRA